LNINATNTTNTTADHGPSATNHHEPPITNQPGGPLPTPYESADLLMRLYEQRREPTMREARAWYARHFNPTSLDDVLQTLAGPNSAYFRMVTSYWEMAASFVNHGAIDEQMFAAANGEQILVFAKVEPFLAEYRTKTGFSHYLANLEQLLMRAPGMKERLAATRERFRAIAAAAQ
jgi:hypothetical protein